MFGNKNKKFHENLTGHVMGQFNKLIDQAYMSAMKMVAEANFPGMTQRLCEVTSKGSINGWSSVDKSDFFDFFSETFVLVNETGDEDSISKLNFYSDFHTALSKSLASVGAIAVNDTSLPLSLAPVYAKLLEMKEAVKILPTLKITLASADEVIESVISKLDSDDDLELVDDYLANSDLPDLTFGEEDDLEVISGEEVGDVEVHDLGDPDEIGNIPINREVPGEDDEVGKIEIPKKDEAAA
ncbi:hypothetical protein ACFL2R_02195 [Patescibacteria group bacterium]